jgi:MFS family permease
MTLPGIVYGFLIASAAGLAFHLIRGGRLGRLGMYLVSAWISFAVGHTVGGWIGLHLWRFGPLNLFPALVGTVLGLMTASFLAGPETPGAAGPGRPPTARGQDS